MKEKEKWFKIKKYPHIGLPIKSEDYDWVKNYVDNPIKIQKHGFLPLLHKTIIKRKYRANKNIIVKNPSGKRRRVKNDSKVRDTFFASHLDAMIFSRYNEIISNAYEKYIDEKSFEGSIVAYRKIPIIKGNKGNKCNIEFAKTTFEFILQNKAKKQSVIVADVTSFFDNLNHKILKKNWCEILGVKSLPKDHYNVFKALTRIKYVESEQLFEAYDKKVIVERGVPFNNSEKEYILKEIESTKYFKEKNVIAYCEKDDFLNNNLNLIISKNNPKGIPQGSPISASLANVYMLDFDQEVFDKIESINGFYQRYSDDLIIICEQENEDEIIEFIRDRIDNLAKLEISESKTKVYRFEEIDNIYKGFEIDEKTKKYNYNKTLEYLGFIFDGERVLIKNSGFAKYYRAMKGAFHRAEIFAKHSKNSDKGIFKPKLYKRFTFKGANRKLVFRPLKNNPKKYKKTKKYYWGNYMSYIFKANESMISINHSDVIKNQSRKFWRNFHKLMKFHESRLK